MYFRWNFFLDDWLYSNIIHVDKFNMLFIYLFSPKCGVLSWTSRNSAISTKKWETTLDFMDHWLEEAKQSNNMLCKGQSILRGTVFLLFLIYISSPSIQGAFWAFSCSYFLSILDNSFFKFKKYPNWCTKKKLCLEQRI